MADATMERSLAAAIESSVAALAWLVPPQYQYQNNHRFQEHDDPAAQQQLLVPPDDDDEDGDGHLIAGDVVAGILDELSPRESDLDERILECPMIQRVLLLAMATLQPDAADVISQQQLEEAVGGEAYHNGGFGAVPAAASAVATLGKLSFRAGEDDDGSADRQSCGSITCSICLEDFEDGEEVSVMPCSGGHGFHTNCIVEWLGQYSNMCPLCRHALPTGEDA